MKKVSKDPLLGFVGVFGVIFIILSATMPVLTIPQSRYYNSHIEEIAQAKNLPVEDVQATMDSFLGQIEDSYSWDTLRINTVIRFPLVLPYLLFVIVAIVSSCYGFGILVRRQKFVFWTTVGLASFLCAFLAIEAILGSKIAKGGWYFLGGVALLLIGTGLDLKRALAVPTDSNNE